MAFDDSRPRDARGRGVAPTDLRFRVFLAQKEFLLAFRSKKKLVFCLCFFLANSRGYIC